MLSIIIPFYNEAESVPVLIEKIQQVMNSLQEQYEIVLVDDGSEEKSKIPSFAKASSFVKTSEDKSAGKQNSEIIIKRHRKQLGKGKALTTGFQASKGDIIIFMDADLQDDPKEIPEFVKKIKDGYEFVNGWRKERNDPVSKTLPSSIFNFFLLKRLFRSKFHDINCGFKAMKRDVLLEIPLYGDNYRFLPILAEQNGFKTTEIPVEHHKRQYGTSKYGFLRIFYGFADTMTTYFVYKFSEKPLHFFGPVGTVIFLAGFVTTFILIFERIFYGMFLYRRPAFQLGILTIIVGIQIIMTGFLGELIVYLHKKRKS